MRARVREHSPYWRRIKSFGQVLGNVASSPKHQVKTNRKVVGDPGIEPGVRLREGVTVPCHTLRPVAHFPGTKAPDVGG